MHLLSHELHDKPFFPIFRTALSSPRFTSHLLDEINNRFIVVKPGRFSDGAVCIHSPFELFNIMYCMDIDNEQRYSDAMNNPVDFYSAFSWCFAITAKRFVQYHHASTFAGIRFSGIWFLPELFYLLYCDDIYTNKKVSGSCFEITDTSLPD